MNISIDAQTLCSCLNSGIGRYTKNIINEILRIHTNSSLEIVLFDFLSRNNNEHFVKKTLNYVNNINIKKCTWLPLKYYMEYPIFSSLMSYNFLLGSYSDVYHFFNYSVPPNVRGKVITTIYDMVFFKRPETMEKGNYNMQKKRLLDSAKRADVIVTTSINSQIEICEYLNILPNKIFVTYCAVDQDLFFPRSYSKKVMKKYSIQGNYILYTGTLEPRKNIVALLKAYKIFAQKNPEISLVLAGSKGWLYDDIFNTVRDLKILNKVIFTGFVQDDDMPFLYSEASAFIFPSLYEGFGMPPLEAMACGTPVIVSNTSSLPEVVGDAGIFVNPLDIENIAFEMDRLSNNTSLQQEYSKKGLIRSKAFSWEDSAKKIIEIYQSLG